MRNIFTFFQHTTHAFGKLVVPAAVGLLALAGCAPAPVQAADPAALIAVTGPAAGELEVREYALVEQSQDSPTHPGFQQHVQAAVAAERSGWRFPVFEDRLAAPNRALEAFGFRLEENQAPPFSGYTLYHQQSALQADIASFWPVSVRQDAAQRSVDFLLPFVTHAGEKLVASVSGIHAWPAQAAEGQPVELSAPTFYGDQVAYAQTSGGVLSVYAGPSLLYSSDEPAQPVGPQSARTLHTWGSPPQRHWALELERHIVMDGQDLALARSADRAYQFHLLDGHPLYFYDKDGLTHLNYAGDDLPYHYDQVVRQNTGDLAVFNPGTSGGVLWFYALRDGLWYYVEIGRFD